MTWCVRVRSALSSDCHGYVCATKLLYRLPETLGLFEKPIRRAWSEDFSATRSAKASTYRSSAELQKGDEGVALLCTKGSGAHTRGQKQSATPNGLGLNLCAASVLESAKMYAQHIVREASIKPQSFFAYQDSTIRNLFTSGWKICLITITLSILAQRTRKNA